MKIGIFVVIYKVIGYEWEKVEMGIKNKKGFFSFFFFLFFFFLFFFFLSWYRRCLDRNSDVELLVFKLVGFDSEVVDLLLHPGWCRNHVWNLNHAPCLKSGGDVELDRVGYGRGFGEDPFPIGGWRRGWWGCLGNLCFLLIFLVLCPNPLGCLLRVNQRTGNAGMARQTTHSTAPALWLGWLSRGLLWLRRGLLWLRCGLVWLRCGLGWLRSRRRVHMLQAFIVRILHLAKFFNFNIGRNPFLTGLNLVRMILNQILPVYRTQSLRGHKRVESKIEHICWIYARVVVSFGAAHWINFPTNFNFFRRPIQSYTIIVCISVSYEIIP